MTDTTPAAKQAQLDAIRRMTPAARVAQALEFSEMMRRLPLGRLRARHPELTELQSVELLFGVTFPIASRARALSR